MLQYAVKRFLMTIPTVLLVSVAVFVLIRLIPGDPASIMLNDLDSDVAIEEMRQELGLDKSLIVQYSVWAKNLLGGDFGTSINTGQPVLSTILSRFGVTLTVTILALLLSAVIAVPAGMIAAWRQNSAIDLAIVFVTILFVSLPTFWLGLLFIFVFAIQLGWFPTIGYVSPFEDLFASVRYLFMPVVTLALVNLAMIARMVRAETLEVLRLEYVTHARAKGLSEWVVMTRHVFKNAIGPALTVFGLTLGALLGGAAVIETVFNLPGLGRLLVDAIYARDYPVLQGCLLMISLSYVVVNFIVDLMHMAIDPRVRF